MIRVKLALIVMLLGVSGTYAHVWSQAERMNVKTENVSMVEMFGILQQQTSLKFVFNHRDVESYSVKVDAADKTLAEILDQVFAGKPLRYEISGQHVIVSRTPATANRIQQPVPHAITGTVTDEKGNPLAGVTVFVQDMDYRRGTSTDAQGKYSLVITQAVDNLMTFSMIGRREQIVPINGRTVVNVVMREGATDMDEVVVTGYSTVRRGDYIGSANTVKEEDIHTGGVSSIDAMLQGKIPGMLVTNTTGRVGAAPKIRVRGTSTLLGNREPLWVVDGVIQRDLLPNYMNDNGLKFSNNDAEMREVASNAISWLNPGDVETITVLKDAAATAIYGSAAANGVIVITTKKAKAGNLQVSYSNEVTMGLRPSYALYDQMDSYEMMQFSYENYKNHMSYPSKPLPIGFAGLIQQLIEGEIKMEEYKAGFNEMERQNTDWFDILFRNSLSHKHNVSVTGGSDKIQSRASIGFEQTFGEAKGNDLDQWTANLTTTFRFNHGIVANVSLKGSIRDVDNFAYGVDPFSYAYNTSRVIPNTDENGEFVYHNKFNTIGESSRAVALLDNYSFNIENEIANTGMRSLDKKFGASIDVEVPVFRNLRYKGLFSYDLGSSSLKSWATERSFYAAQYRGYDYNEYAANSPEYLSSPMPIGGVLHTEDYQSDDMTIRNDFTYDNLFADRHRVTLQAGFEMRSSKLTGNLDTRYGYVRERGEGFASVPDRHYIHGATTGNEEKNALIDEMRKLRQVKNRVSNYMSGYFLGVYSYDHRYIVNVSARIDASNRFGQDNNKKWQPTWSVGGKWRAANESFAQNWNLIDMLDFSISYGYQGNTVEDISPYLIAGMGQWSEHYQQYIMNVKSYPYPGLGWEKTHTVNYSVEAALLNNRLNFVFEYYDKLSDILSERPIPWENGAKKTKVAGAQMRNRGYDFIVNVVPVRTENWTWQLSVNAGKVMNETRHNDIVNTLTDYLNGTAVVNGKSTTTLYSVKFKGLDQTDGTPLFDLGKDIDGSDYPGTSKNKITDDPLDYLVRTGKLTPDFNGGLNTRITYRQWSLQANFSIQFGGSGRLPKLYDYESNRGVPYPETNVSRQLKNRWQKPGDDTTIPSVPGVGRYGDMFNGQFLPSETSPYNPYMLYYFSDLRVAKTDMIRCNQLAISYEFGDTVLSRTGLGRLGLKLSTTNPFFIAFDKAWKGIDPETGNWPLRRMFVFSLSASF